MYLFALYQYKLIWYRINKISNEIIYILSHVCMYVLILVTPLRMFVFDIWTMHYFSYFTTTYRSEWLKSITIFLYHKDIYLRIPTKLTVHCYSIYFHYHPQPSFHLQLPLHLMIIGHLLSITTILNPIRLITTVITKINCYYH